MSDDETKTTSKGDDAGEQKPFKERFMAFVEEYGPIAFVTWFTIFFSTWAAFYFLLSAGMDLGGWLSSGEQSGWLWNLVKDWGAVGLAYIPTQVVKPIRIAATFAITPVLHRYWTRLRGKSGDGEGDELSKDEDVDESSD